MAIDFADKKVAVLGAGKMGGILLEAFLRSGLFAPALGARDGATPGKSGCAGKETQHPGRYRQCGGRARMPISF